MRTVVDASVALKWYFPEAGSDDAQRVLAEAIDGERQLLAPDPVCSPTSSASVEPRRPVAR